MAQAVDRSQLLELTPFTEDLRGRAIPSIVLYDPQYDRESLPEYMDDEEVLLGLCQ
jgi:thioredoxin-related protein